MDDLADEKQLRALNAVLRVIARHPDMLQKDAFEEMALAMAGFLPFARMAVFVPEEPILVPSQPSFVRTYALSRGPADPVPFGGRIPANDDALRTVFVDRRAHFCDDMRLGTEIERAATSTGVLSYVALPILAGARAVTMGETPRPPARPVAELVFAFAEVGGARRAPIALFQEIADVMGASFERALRLVRERRLARILETSGDALLAWDRDGRITDANGAAEALTGRARGELVGTPIAELLDPLPRPCEPGGVRLELTVRAPEGPRRVVVAATVTALEDDALVAGHALLRDLSRVVAAEEEAAARLSRIHELEEQHRTLLDNTPLIIFRLDPATGELVYLNRHAERLLGVPTPEALATPGFLRAAHADADGVSAFDEAVARAGLGALSLPYEARLARRGGEAITVRGTVYPLLGERGQVVAVEGVLADVSAEHAARTRLVQADRLSTLGTLAAGVAHEINNPAAFILLGLDLLDRALRGPGVDLAPLVEANARETISELRESIRRIADIARDLRLFARSSGADGGRRSIVDVNRTVESALSLTRGQILERAQIVRELTEVPPVLMDDGRLGQVVVNLLVNASQAIPRSYAHEHYIMVATRSDGITVELEVRDTGVGISEETMPRIWQPFFTTKSADVGTGLGLSISREIVERAGGTIVAESPVPGSDPPCGARFVITLPAAGQKDTVPPISSQLPGAKQQRARVLVVEDEPALGRALAEEIGRRHEVTVVLGASEALSRMASAEFDVILCDLRMPGMSGEALYAEVLARDEARARSFIFMTGVGFGTDVEKFLSEAGRPVLEKPFAAEQMLEAIARVAKRRAARR